MCQIDKGVNCDVLVFLLAWHKLESPERGDFSWGIASNILACVHFCKAFSWLIVGVEETSLLWLMPPLDRWSCVVQENRLSNPHRTSQYSSCLQVPASRSWLSLEMECDLEIIRWNKPFLLLSFGQCPITATESTLTMVWVRVLKDSSVKSLVPSLWCYWEVVGSLKGGALVGH